MKEQIVFTALEDRIVADVEKLAHDWHCAAARSSMFDGSDDVFEFHRQEATKTYRSIGRTKLSWYKCWKAEEKSIAQAYKEFLAEGKDPRFKNWRKQVKKGMLEKITSKQEEARILIEAQEKIKQSKEARDLTNKKRKDRNARKR